MAYKDPEKGREARRRWREKNPDYAHQWYQRNKERTLENVRRWRLLNADKVVEIKKQWLKANARKRSEVVRRYAQRNPEKILANLRRRRLNPHQRLRDALSARLNQAIRKQSCGIKTIEMLGCSLTDFVIYLESKFEVGMSWENYGNKKGQWSVDHIIPCAIFDLTKLEHRLRCFHFSNLQPMWHIKNMRKNAKITTNQFNLL